MLKAYFSDKQPEAGCDEAGRGCPAGPVFAAAVILHPDRTINGLDDSKKLSEKKRGIIRRDIEDKASAWGVAMIGPRKIDKINILNASLLAMHRALQKLCERPASIIADGNRFKAFEDIPHSCIVKGDSKYQSIAAASILAKTYRDEYMLKIHKKYPQYGWKSNKGYATRQHREAVMKYGLTPYHRRSFVNFYAQLKIDFKNT